MAHVLGHLLRVYFSSKGKLKWHRRPQSQWRNSTFDERKYCPSRTPVRSHVAVPWCVDNRQLRGAAAGISRHVVMSLPPPPPRGYGNVLKEGKRRNKDIGTLPRCATQDRSWRQDRESPHAFAKHLAEHCRDCKNSNKVKKRIKDIIKIEIF